MWLTVIIFLVCNFVVVLVTMAERRHDTELRDGMLLAVHVPPEALADPEVQRLCHQTARLWRITHLVNLPLAVLICLPSLGNVAAGVLVEVIWLLLYIAWTGWLIYHAHWRMYRIKCDRGWFFPATRRVVHVDTLTAARSDRGVPGLEWQLPILLLLALPLPAAGQVQPSLRSMFWIFFGSAAAAGVLLAALQMVGIRRPNRMLSADPVCNVAVNRMQKRAWAWSMLLAGSGNTAAWCWMGWRLTGDGWPGTLDYGIYLLLVTAGALCLVIGLVSARSRTRRMIAGTGEPAVTDDDEYWAKGVYCNPDDPSLFVQSRFNSMQLAMNVGHPVGRVLSILGIVTSTVAILALLLLLIPFIHPTVRLQPDGAGLEFSAAYYHYTIQPGEIRSVELLDSMPQESFLRTNGGASRDWTVGYFTGSESGACMLFVYPGSSPVIRVRLEDWTIYANSRDPEQTRQWAALLLEQSTLYLAQTTKTG